MTDDLGFLAPRGDLADWRMILLVNNAVTSGLLDALPATATEAATSIELHPKSTRVLLDALTVFDVVAVDGEGDGDSALYRPGPDVPDADQRAIIDQHARFIGRWASELPGRMADPMNEQRRPWVRAGLAGWLRSLGARARGEAPAVVDRCLAEFPNAKTVLDVAGGHGEYGMEAARRGLDVTLLDLPQVIDIVSEWPAVQQSGLRTWAGDVFQAQTSETYDLVFCFGFTHTQPADRIAEVFPLVAGMTNPGGGLCVNTFLRTASPTSKLFAIQMLIAGNNGDTHSFEQYTDWITGAGYAEPSVDHHDGRSLLLAIKPT